MTAFVLAEDIVLPQFVLFVLHLIIAALTPTFVTPAYYPADPPHETLYALAPHVVSTPEPTPVATPTPKQNLPPPPKPEVQAATNGIPWFVPPQFHDAYLACIASPDRYAVRDYVWRASIEGGNPDGWPYADAMNVVAHEGGEDFCQFNTGGSGACGPFQLYHCPTDGLVPSTQISGALAKFHDGNSFARHWYPYWR